MASEGTAVRVVIESYRESRKVALSMAELGQAIIVSNRIVNHLAANADELRYEYSPSREEPPFVDLEITEVRQGSVILDALAQVVTHPLAQGVATSIAGAAIYDHAPATVRAVARGLGRLARAAHGKTLVVRIRIGNSAYRIDSSYWNGRMHQKVEQVPPDDVQ
ncbi:hypothetical protein [Pseudoxanthomonas mexicana]|uniref:hypothetical protein n=1 Tax=Pseudoxanthomonas mexicana TaxID=128785 RepID=UPI0022F39EF8|nr:hypothetical protein [Pseudoxanthomonas mexicana]WBX94534.1 hypothetical protein PE064_04910 [Pseudoxanthomonas mexicana]